MEVWEEKRYSNDWGLFSHLGVGGNQSQKVNFAYLSQFLLSYLKWILREGICTQEWGLANLLKAFSRINNLFYSSECKHGIPICSGLV